MYCETQRMCDTWEATKITIIPGALHVSCLLSVACVHVFCLLIFLSPKQEATPSLLTVSKRKLLTLCPAKHTST